MSKTANVSRSPRGDAPQMKLRRNLLWLIAGRAAAITFVLGSAILVQYRAEHTPALAWFQISPFFALIGLTYALTL